MVAAGTVPMVCAVLKRHDLMPQLQRDGTATLAALLADEGGGRQMGTVSRRSSAG